MSLPIDGAQKTLRERVTLSGIGVHSGKPVTMVIGPADPNAGILFSRTDAAGNNGVDIAATCSAVASTRRCTVLGDPNGAYVATVEHLLAALSALGVDNALIEIDGPEVPVMDGSAAAFVEAIDSAGLMVQSAGRRFIKVVKPVRVEMGDAFAEFRPHDGRRLEIEIDFACGVIGRQVLAVDLTAHSFRHEIARARTFGYLNDVERLWEAGLALGSSLENSVVIGEDAVINPEGLRWADEFVRHKVLDVIGDLALAEGPIIGAYRSYKGGHKLNAEALGALLSCKDAFETVTAPASGARKASVKTLGESRGETRGDALPGVPAPAFAPDIS
jgi:UDP-3-O-[3-hydroxymyristoyl] N-acetylglucosamine deacetylase